MVKVEHFLMTRHLIMSLTVALLVIQSCAVKAQGVFPAPLPGRVAPPANDPAFPPVNGAAPVASIGAAPGTSRRKVLRTRAVICAPESQFCADRGKIAIPYKIEIATHL